MDSSSSRDAPSGGVQRLVLARSYLFVPADRPERITKAFAAAPDVVIVDLEDAVAPAMKASARDALANHLREQWPVVVRINASETPWYAADAELCRHPGVIAAMLPKAEDSGAIADLSNRLVEQKPILPLIETARGLWNVLAIAQSAAVRRLAFGPLDFQVDLGIGADDEMMSYRAQLVLASRVAGIASPVDGPATAIDDMSVVQAEALRAKRMGFNGKLCIHPRQVPVVNQCFSPSEAEVTWAERVLDAVRATAGAATVVDGKMVDRPVLIRAESILQRRSYSCSQTP